MSLHQTNGEKTYKQISTLAKTLEYGANASLNDTHTAVIFNDNNKNWIGTQSV